MSCKVKKLCNKSNYHRHAARPRTPPDGSGAKSGCRQNDTVCKGQKHTTPAAMRPYAMTGNIRPHGRHALPAAGTASCVTKNSKRDDRIQARTYAGHHNDTQPDRPAAHIPPAKYNNGRPSMMRGGHQNPATRRQTAVTRQPQCPQGGVWIPRA